MNAFSKDEEGRIFSHNETNAMHGRGMASSTSSKSFQSPNTQHQPKLRSKVVLTKPSYNASSPKHIQLDTYHDQSDIQRVLAKLQDACGYELNSEEEEARMSHRVGGSSLASPLLLDQLSADVLLRCFSFVNLKTLGILCTISKRFNTLGKTYTLWEPHAAARGIEIVHRRTTREEMRDALESIRLQKEKEVADCEEAYEELAQRMNQRTEAIKSESVNVDHMLYLSELQLPSRSNARSGNTAPLAASSNTRVAEKDFKALTSLPKDFIGKVEEALVKLEKLRNNVMDKMDANNQIVQRQQEKMLMIEQRLDGKRGPETEFMSNAGFTAADIVAFERRLTRLIINGRSLASATPSGDSELILPVVLRRGITDFGTLELLCLDTTLPEKLIQPIRARYAAFKGFFPLNDDYYTVCSIIESLPSGKQLDIPQKYAALFQKITGILSRIQSMSDGDILNVVL